MTVSFRIGADNSRSEIQWLWKDHLLANSVNMIGGRKGSGKTSAIASILGAWRAGVMPDGSKPHKPLRRIMWFSSEEDTDKVICPRQALYKIKPVDVVTVDRRVNFGLNRAELPRDLQLLTMTIREHKVDAVIVDPWLELKPVAFDSKSDTATRDYITWMLSIAEQTETTWILVGHLTKGKSANALNELAGSAQVAATCRSVLRCDHPDKTKSDRYLSVLECNLGSPVYPIHYQVIPQKNGLARVEWGEIQEMSVVEISSLADEADERDLMIDAKNVIIQCLTSGKNSSKAILTEASDCGISNRTMTRAKYALGVKSKRVKSADGNNMIWVWFHPDYKPVKKST